MKKRSNNKWKIRILISIAVAFVFLTGSLFYHPTLKNADKPFIELSGSVGTAIGNAKKAYAVSESSQSSDPSATPSVTMAESNEIRVLVSDEEIKIGINTYGSAEIFENAVNSSRFAGKTFVLVDDYAEAVTFRSVIRTLDKLGKTYRIEENIG